MCLRRHDFTGFVCKVALLDTTAIGPSAYDKGIELVVVEGLMQIRCHGPGSLWVGNGQINRIDSLRYRASLVQVRLY